MVTPEVFWRIFESTGSIAAYILYKRFQAQMQSAGA